MLGEVEFTPPSTGKGRKMAGEIGRLAPYGVFVTFLLEGTDEILWKAPMEIIPRPNDRVGHRNHGSTVDTWYKVEKINWEFEREEPVFHGEPPAPPEPFPREISQFGVYIYVSVVL